MCPIIPKHHAGEQCFCQNFVHLFWPASWGTKIHILLPHCAKGERCWHRGHDFTTKCTANGADTTVRQVFIFQLSLYTADRCPTCNTHNRYEHLFHNHVPVAYPVFRMGNLVHQIQKTRYGCQTRPTLSGRMAATARKACMVLHRAERRKKTGIRKTHHEIPGIQKNQRGGCGNYRS